MARKEDPLDFGLGLEGLVAAVRGALSIVDPEGVIERANASVARMFCHAPDDLVGTQIEALVPAQFRAEHERSRRAFRRAPFDRPMSCNFEITARRRDGSEFPVDIELRPRRSTTIVVVRQRDDAESAQEALPAPGQRPAAARPAGSCPGRAPTSRGSRRSSTGSWQTTAGARANRSRPSAHLSTRSDSWR